MCRLPVLQTGDTEASLPTRQGGVHSVPADHESQRRCLSSRVQADVAGTLLPHHASLLMEDALTVKVNGGRFLGQEQ